MYWCHPPNRLIMTLLIQVCCSYDTSVNSHNSKVQGKNLHVSFLPPSVELVHSLVKRVERLESQCTLLTNHVLMMQLVSERFSGCAYTYMYTCMLWCFYLRDVHHPVFKHHPVIQHGTHHHHHSAHCLNQQLHFTQLDQVFQHHFRASYYRLLYQLHGVHLFALLNLHDLF